MNKEQNTSQTIEPAIAVDTVLAAVHITKCKRCGREKTWNGDDILCPFQNGEIFGDNWCCGQLAKIRLIIENATDKGDGRIHYQYCEGQQYSTINVSDISLDENAESLYVTWYKSRGRIEGMWLMNQDYSPRKPKYEELQKIIEYYSLYCG